MQDFSTWRKGKRASRLWCNDARQLGHASSAHSSKEDELTVQRGRINGLLQFSFLACYEVISETRIYIHNWLVSSNSVHFFLFSLPFFFYSSNLYFYEEFYEFLERLVRINNNIITSIF